MRDIEVNSPPESRASTTVGRSGAPNQAAESLPSGSTGSSASTAALSGLTRFMLPAATRYVLQLQQQQGNRRVQRMLAAVRTEDAERASSQAVAPSIERDTRGSGEWGSDGADGQISARAEIRTPAPPTSRTVQREPEDATGGDAAPAAPTERPAGTLWATDASGKTLPPSLDDISQGAVNDCFLFAAMSAIVSADPQKIVNMIQDNGNGTYTVTFRGIGFFSSAEQTVSADFTVGQHGNVTARKALWPLVIEKAYAQQKGGLQALGKGGNAGTALDEMLNDGPSRFDPREKPADYILGKLAKAKEKKWPMTILSPKQEGTTQDKQALADHTPGLHFWHTYAIIDVDSDNNRIKLFNPWGHDHPNGDGWMNIEQVRTFFIEIDIND
jgi:hypothetical protein